MKPPFTHNPYTGTPRDPRDIASDPFAVLCVAADEPLRAATQAPSAPVARALQKRDPVEFSLSLIAEWNEGPQDVDTWGNHAASQLEVLGQLVHESRIAALSVKAEPAAIQEGWQLVPKDPTGVMKDQGSFSGLPIGCASAWVAASVYRAMLAAAPTPPTTGEE